MVLCAPGLRQIRITGSHLLGAGMLIMLLVAGVPILPLLISVVKATGTAFGALSFPRIPPGMPGIENIPGYVRQVSCGPVARGSAAAATRPVIAAFRGARHRRGRPAPASAPAAAPNR